MKTLRTLTAAICLTLFVALVVVAGCQDYVMPCYVDERVGKYTGEEMTSLMPYTTVADSDRLELEMEYVQEGWILYFEQMLEERELEYDFLTTGLQRNRDDARELQAVLFAPDGAFGAMTGLLGLGAGWMFLKRPGDLRKEDVEEV